MGLATLDAVNEAHVQSSTGTSLEAQKKALERQLGFSPYRPLNRVRCRSMSHSGECVGGVQLLWGLAGLRLQAA